MTDTKQIKWFVTTECKEFNDDEMSFVAYASTEAIDRDDEVIKAGGWKLDEYTKSPVLQVDHKLSVRDTAGKAQWTKVERDGLKFKPQFAKTSLGRDLYELYKMGALTSFSVGFMPIAWEDHTEGKVKRTITEQNLIEISCVTVPSNTEAIAQRLHSGEIKTKSLAKGLQHVIDEIEEKAKVEETDNPTEADETKATFDIIDEKATDLAGNPSIHDVMRAVRSELSRTPEGEQHVYVLDIFPINSGAGNVIVEFDTEASSDMRSQIWQYSYTYNPETETATVFDPVAVESTFERKDFADFQKAGRVLSGRTMGFLTKARDSMGTAIGDIDGLLSEQDKPEKDSEPEVVKEPEVDKPEPIDIKSLVNAQFKKLNEHIEENILNKSDVSDIVASQVRRAQGRLT